MQATIHQTLLDKTTSKCALSAHKTVPMEQFFQVNFMLNVKKNTGLHAVLVLFNFLMLSVRLTSDHKELLIPGQRLTYELRFQSKRWTCHNLSSIMVPKRVDPIPVATFMIWLPSLCTTVTVLVVDTTPHLRSITVSGCILMIIR